MTVNNPENGKNPGSIEKEEVIIVMLLWNRYNFDKIIFDTKTFENSNDFWLTFKRFADYGPNQPQKD